MDLSRGCVLVARSLDESDIFQNEKWLKVWIWCLIQANHKGKFASVNIGKSKTSVWVERGQFIFGRHKSAERLGMKPSTVRNIMEILSSKPFENIKIDPTPHYTVVTINDYDFYQVFGNYKGQAEGQLKDSVIIESQADEGQAKGQPEDNQGTPDGQPEDTTKTPKTPISLKTPKEEIPQNEFAENEEFYLTKKKRKLKGKRLITFNRFWKCFNYKKDKASAADSWIDIPELTDALVNEICKAAEIEAVNRPAMINKGLTPIYAQGWLTAKRWEDEQIYSEEKTTEDKEFDEQFNHMMTE